MRLILGITGATGSIIGVRILQALRVQGVETHLVLSRWGRATLEMETDLSAAEVCALADRVYGHGDQAAPISSGSFPTDGMIVAPCSMKTLAAIRIGFGEGLIPRAADVTLKERRRLVLVPRETPFSEIHLENMLTLCRMGTVIAPPVPAFYNRPETIDDIVTHIAARVLDQFGLELPQAQRWTGPPARERDTIVAQRHAGPPCGQGTARLQAVAEEVAAPLEAEPSPAVSPLAQTRKKRVPSTSSAGTARLWPERSS